MPAWLKTVIGGVVIVGAVALLLFAIHCKEQRAREPFDADKYLASGMKEATGHGAELQSIEVTYLTPDARVHTEYGGKLTISWVARGANPDEKAPMPGAPRKGGGDRCTDYWLNVELESDSDSTYLDDDMNMAGDRSCWQKTAPGPLFCTFKALWARAIAAGAPNPGLATIKLETRDDKTRRWTFTIVDNVQDGPKQTLFAAEYADDCEPKVER